MDKELYTKLLTLRSRLKFNFKENGRVPLVCSDEALISMSTFVPKKLSDFYAIEGIGDTFVEKYGDYFMRVIDEYNYKKTCVFDDDIKSTLYNLENRLVNISQSNKLLYTGKLYPKHAVDLYNEGFLSDEKNQNILDLILGKKSKIVLCDTRTKDVFDENLYKNANILIREISRQFKETGEFDMFIAYPFVRGYHADCDFKVNAPLLLFPVTYEKTNDKIILKRDYSRDVLYNSNLILLRNKIDNKNRELPMCEIDEFDASNFVEKAIEFYKENGIDIFDTNENKFCKFEQYTEKTFPKKIKNYVIDYKALLGKFSLCNSAIQRDYKKMIESNRVNSLVEKLITDIKDVDFNEEDKVIQKDVQYVENDCYYINELNSSQENVIVGIHDDNEFVIQGPPGTGKSQTITSIISDFVCHNKNVLVVSQKKVALEVIYSRLGNLSKYAMLLSAGGDKDTFYNSLTQMFSSTGRVINYQTKLDLIGNEIEDTLKVLDKIKQDFVANSNESNILCVYDESINNYFLNHSDELSLFFDNVNSSLLKLEYSQLKSIKQKFDDLDYLKSMLKYINLIKTYPWLNQIKLGLQSYAKNALNKSICEFTESQNAYLKKSFFVKIFSFCKQKKKLKSILKEYFVDDTNFNFLFKNPDNFSSGIKQYNEYLTLHQVYETLSQAEQEYLESVFNMINLNIYSVENLNQYVFDFLIHCFIENFEINNSQSILNVQNYAKICLKLKNLINDKIELTKKQTNSILYDGINLIKNSKRFSEISRLCENKHKRDIKKFTEKYSYELLKGIKVWLLTPEAVSEVLPMQDGLFDVVVFDEASQIYIERSLPTIFRGKKVVVSGDHKQL
ncbi:MAG: AAA domain-containing protein, partial [Christensenellales bacterium]